MVSRILAAQNGVISRKQALAAGLDDNDIEKQLRHHLWTPLHRGVYVAHNSDPTWIQRVWAATLRHDPAAAGGRTALALHGLAPEQVPVHVSIDAARRVAPEHGVVVRRARAFADNALLGHHPPRMRLEHAALEVASSLPRESDVVGLLCDAVGSRRTTPQRLLDQLDGSARVSRRDFMRGVLDDATHGVHSVLENRYVHDVERRHRLPKAERQVRRVVDGLATYDDMSYLGGLLVVELDGRLGHEAARDRWADAQRDLVTLTRGGRTLRLTWGQVLEPCRTAALVRDLLRALGWRGTPRSCGADCLIR